MSHEILNELLHTFNLLLVHLIYLFSKYFSTGQESALILRNANKYLIMYSVLPSGTTYLLISLTTRWRKLRSLDTLTYRPGTAWSHYQKCQNTSQRTAIETRSLSSSYKFRNMTGTPWHICSSFPSSMQLVSMLTTLFTVYLCCQQ